jgi:hypothetical protein
MASSPQPSGLKVGVKVREIATSDATYRDVSILHSDSVGLVFEVHRTVAEGGNIENVVSQMLVPWANVRYVLVLEESV